MKEKAFAILAAVSISALVAFGCSIGNTYKAEGIITAVNGNLITVDANGHLYDFYGDDFSVGDYVSLKMDTNCTEERLADDIVVDAEKKN